jgi:hypothetical protein
MTQLLRARFSLMLAVVLASLALASCNEKQAVVDGIVALQTTAISLNATIGSDGQPILSTPQTIKVVTYTTQALKIIQANQTGWQAAVKTGWAAFLSDIPQATKDRLAVPIGAISGAIGAL